jgi:hypothetical protein
MACLDSHEWHNWACLLPPPPPERCGDMVPDSGAAPAEETPPRGAAPQDMPTVMIIQRCRPAELKTDAISSVAWFAHWLALWAACSMTVTKPSN